MRKPLNYMVTWKMVNSALSAAKSLLAATVAGAILTIPLFFEPVYESRSSIVLKSINRTHTMLVSDSTRTRTGLRQARVQRLHPA